MMLRYFVLVFPLFIPLSARAGVVINEVAWMGMIPKAGESTSAAASNEWIEIANTGGSTVDLTGWKIEWRNGEYNAPVVADAAICPHTSISAGGYFLFERTNDDSVPDVPMDCKYTGALNNLPKGEYLILKDASGMIVDEINAELGWPAGDNSTKDTMQRSGENWITAAPTPRAKNAGIVVVSPSPIAPPSSYSDSTFTVPPPPSSYGSSAPASLFPVYTIQSGRDMAVAVGTLMEFVGYVAGVKNEPIENARFLWNFGDGETKEGRAVNYIYQIPGKYTVGLHVSIGDRAVSDYHTVEVVPNQLTIRIVVEGEQGFIAFVNPSEREIDIGGWLLDDGGGVRFVIPSHTKIADRSEAALANKTTKLLLGKTIYPITLRFPNGVIALQKFPQIAPVVPVLPVASEQTKKQNITEIPETKTPAKKIPSQAVFVPESSYDKASSSASSSESQFASVSEQSSRGTFFWFAAAFAVSFACALGFIAFKRFL